MRHPLMAALLLGSLLGSASALAAAAEKTPDPIVMTSEGFLNAHPDMKYRLSGLAAFERGELERAFNEFKRGAKYADKPSQAMVAEMLWRGEGVAADRAAAYAWMDLAAERHFHVMLIKREAYWAALTPEEQARALEIGREVYAEYGDDVAKKRLERVLRRAKSQTTGSRTGMVGSLQIQFPTPAGPITVNGSSYYDPEFWQPERYWAWQESQWKDPPKGIVDIGPLQRPVPDEEVTPPQD